MISAAKYLASLIKPSARHADVLVFHDEKHKRRRKGEEDQIEDKPKRNVAVIEENSGMNGFFILAILSMATQFVSIKFNAYLSRKKAIKQGIPVAEDPNSNKSMSIIMPVIMGIFAIFYNAAFGIYLVASGLVSFITGTISTLVVDNIDVITFKKNKEKKRASYSRK